MTRRVFAVLLPAFCLSAGLLAIYLVLVSVGIETVSFAFLLGFPTLAGGIIMWLRPQGAFRSFGKSVAWLVGIMAGSVLLSYVTGVEGLICIAMAAAPLLVGVMLGGFIYLLLLRWRDHPANGLKVVVWPLIALVMLASAPARPRIYEISNHILIDAPVDLVFRSIKSIPDITPEEVPTHFSHLLGVPKPTSALWEQGDHGTVRHSYWGDGVHFREVITDVVPNRRIAWDFSFPEGWVAAGIEDPHIRVGGRYFDVLSGEYTLLPQGAQTRLTLTTRTYDASGLGAYAKFWHHVFFEDFHEAILSVVAARASAAS